MNEEIEKIQQLIQALLKELTQLDEQFTQLEQEAHAQFGK